MPEVFSCDDLLSLTDTTTSAWRAGLDRDWSARAGVMEWTCFQTAEHVVDTVLAPAFFLASRKLDDYPAGRPWALDEGETVERLIESLETATRILVAVVTAAPPDTRAIIWRNPAIETRRPEDFPARAGLELALHAHDVCSGLGIPFRPAPEVAQHLREQTCEWPIWGGYWKPLPMTPDAWDDLLRATGRR